MKCALIIPSWVPAEIFASRTAGSQINYWQPVGTLSVVLPCCSRPGTRSGSSTAPSCPTSRCSTRLRRFQPRFIGLYATTFDGKKRSGRPPTLRAELGREPFICAGGPYPIAVQERCLADAGPSIDAVVTGEGEYTVLEIVERLDAAGTCGASGERSAVLEGSFVVNPPRPLIIDP